MNMKNDTEQKVSHTPTPWATDGRMIVQEIDGKSFWSNQPYVADCCVSEAIRGKDNTIRNAEFIVLACNAHDALEVRVESLKSVILTLLDQVDYNAGACSATEMVGAVLPKEVIALARKALAQSSL